MPNPQGPDILAGLYYEWSFPLGLYNIIHRTIRDKDDDHDPNTPDVDDQRAPRAWFSQPRPGHDPTIEVLHVNFRLPLQVGHLSFRALRVPCTISAWYQDRHHNWIPMTDTFGNPISIKLNYSSAISWYTYETPIYPIVAEGIQLRLQRQFDPQLGNNPYVVGLTNTLLRRNVYAIEDTVAAIEDQQDPLGNLITSYVKHWDAGNAIDNDPTTFWRSFPCPDPKGVVALYLDTRTSGGSPQLIDTVYLDPIYTGNTLNLYYSNDPITGTLILNPISLPPDTQVNCTWKQGVGLKDTAGADLSDSQFLCPVALGPLGKAGPGEAIWFGIEWTPDFNPASGPPQNPILLSNTPLDPTATAADGQYWISIYYDVGAGQITLEFTNGTLSVDYHCPLSPTFTQFKDLQIVVGWTYSPNTVFIEVRQQNTQILGSVTITPAASLPTKYVLDGELGYTNFRGLMTALVVKLEPWTNGFAAFQNNPTDYANAGSVRPDTQGNFPSTTLDNAVIASDWTTQQFPIGGTHESWYESKTWTPILSNYITKKGNLFLPQATSMSYLKMEFTDLTPEPYPVYDQGIAVTYNVFPVSEFTGTMRVHGDGTVDIKAQGMLSLGADILTMTIGSVNWFNPSTVQNAINANWGVTQPAIQVVTGPGTITTTIPNAAQANISGSYRSEMSSPWIYPRKMLNPAYLAGQHLTTIANASTSTQTMQSVFDPVSTQVTNTFTPVTTNNRSNVLPQQGNDWWLFPGANLKFPAAIMRFLTGTNVVVAKTKKPIRIRFTTIAIHRYATNTITLDAAIAYFAGVNEVQPYKTSYISGNDPQSFSYSQYDPHTFVYSANVFQEVSGPLSTAGTPYVLENPDFEYPLETVPWTLTGPWYWDSQHGPGSENGQGDEPALAIVADGLGNYTAVSEPFAVNPGDQVVVSALVAYFGATSAPVAEFPLTFPYTFGFSADEAGLSISGVIYNGVASSTVDFSMPTTTAIYVVSSQAAMLALAASINDSCTITNGQFQGTYTLVDLPATTFTNWHFTGYGTLVNQPTGDIDGRRFVRLTGTYTVPGSGVDHLAVSLNVNNTVTGGTIYWGNVRVNPAAGIEATVSLDATTTSTFADVAIKVNDSGLVTSDAMWARVDPLATNIDNLQLAPYVNTIPSIIPAGVWADTFADWADTTIDWGEPQSVVKISVDPNLIFQGNRAVHFVRAAGAGEAGILITQQTNMLANEPAQLGCVFFKTAANANQVTVRLRRVSDGVYIHSETFTPPVGYWYTWRGQFFDLPNIFDQVYTVEFVTTGDAADEIYLSNLFTSVAGARYALQLGGSLAPLIDVTSFVYQGNCHVTVNTPVNEFLFVATVASPNMWIYGVSISPKYLR